MRGNPTPTRDLRRERLVGNWGGASEHIGRRWEEAGLEVLRARLESGSLWPAAGGYIPLTIVPLAGDDALQLALSRSGLPSPDVIMVLQNPSQGLALQALDFKWNLEFATYGQIRSQAVKALLQKGVRPLRALLSEVAGEQPGDLPVLDGLLFAPALPVNHWFLHSPENARQEYPIDLEEVLFEEVDPFHFFEPLPGWEMASLLAQVDRSDSKLRALEGAEHYYRLGAGLQGGVAQLLVSVFVRQPPPVPARQAMDWLRSKVRPASSVTFVQQAEKLMATRSQLAGRLRNVARSPYRFSDLVEALKARSLPLPEKEDSLPPRERERWGEVLRKVAVEHKELVYRTGLRLVQTGLSDAEALARLEADARRYADRARARADQLIAATLPAAGTP